MVHPVSPRTVVVGEKGKLVIRSNGHAAQTTVEFCGQRLRCRSFDFSIGVGELGVARAELLPDMIEIEFDAKIAQVLFVPLFEPEESEASDGESEGQE